MATNTVTTEMVEDFVEGRSDGNILFGGVMAIAGSYHARYIASHMPECMSKREDFISTVSILVLDGLRHGQFDKEKGSFSNYIYLKCREAWRVVVNEEGGWTVPCKEEPGESSHKRHAMPIESLDAQLSGCEGGTLMDICEDSHAEKAFYDFEDSYGIESAMELLSDNQREVIKRTLNGESGKEIAEAMGICENTVYTLRRRAEAAMRDELEH